MKSHNFSYSGELTKIEFAFQKKREDSFPILTHGKAVDMYSSIRADYSKLSDAVIIMEAVSQLGDHIEDYATFYSFLEQILDSLNQNPYHGYYLTVFRIKLLYLLGVGPVFSKCINCGSREQLVGFDFSSGGMKCRNCSDHSLYQSDAISILQFLYLTKLPYLTHDVLSALPEYCSETSRFLDRYYEQYLGYKSRAEKVIHTMQSK
jgi:DNA repair protein RecO